MTETRELCFHPGTTDAVFVGWKLKNIPVTEEHPQHGDGADYSPSLMQELLRAPWDRLTAHPQAGAACKAPAFPSHMGGLKPLSRIW